ncbi:MAG: hypothetical protein ABL883_14925 [Terricaulis sp.]
MNQSDAKNPEHRANNAILCFCIGMALAGGAYFLGVGAVLAAALSGGDPGIVVGGVLAALGLVLMGVAGFVMMLVGAVWMALRVIADQSGDADEKRYRRIER